MKTILVADDEFDVLNSIKVVLEDEGYKVVACSNGRDVLALIDEVHPDLLIVDTMMPHLTGIEVLQRIAKSSEKKRVPSIMMSHVPPAAKRQELKWEALLMKPFTLDQLISVVRRVIGA